jgi:hypothetical protein
VYRNIKIKVPLLQQEGVGELGDPLLRLEKRVGYFTKKNRRNTKYIIYMTIPLGGVCVCKYI